MKIRFSSTWKQMGKTVSFWWKLKPRYERYWMGQLIYIGTNCLNIIIDLRGINTFQDFADALSYPKIWHILKKHKR